MSPLDQPGRDCLTPGRRRTRPVLRSARGRARDACREQTRQPIDRGDNHPRPTRDPHSELEGFARWFADWWLRRGRELTSTHNHGGRDE